METVFSGKQSQEAVAERVALVLIVDLDDDIGEVLGESLIVGYERVVEAGLAFATERPDDADVNTIFSGIQLYRRLSGLYSYVEIAIVGGDRRGGIEAQRKLRERVEALLNGLGGRAEVYIVGDGGEEYVASHIIRDIADVVGIKSVVVSQHLGIESNYMLIARYVRKALTDPQYSVMFVGIPGLIITSAALLLLAGFFSLALKISMLILGVAMVVYGFRLEGTIKTTIMRFVEEIRQAPHIRLGGLMALILLSSIGVALAYLGYKSSGVSYAIVSILSYTIPLTLTGVITYVLISRVLASASEGKIDISRNLALMSILGFTALAFYDLGSTLQGLIESGVDPLGVALQGVTQSKFIQYIVVGAGLASLTELVSRALREL